MSGVEQRLQELGLSLPEAPTPVAAYVPAVTSGNLVFVSGQGCVRDGQVIYEGQIGKDRTLEEGKQAAQLCCLNALAVLKTHIGDLDRIERVVKLLGWVASAPDFYQQPWVINGASELLEKVLEDKGKHARSAVSAHVLPLNIAVELELIVEIA